MTLQKIRVKYEKICAKCKQPVKQNETALFNPDTKDIYHERCNPQLSEVDIPENLDLIAKIDDMTIQIQHYNTHFQVIHAMLNSIEDRVKRIENVLVKIPAPKPAPRPAPKPAPKSKK